MSEQDFREVVRLLRPDWTDEQFEREWDSFMLARDLWRRRN